MQLVVAAIGIIGCALIWSYFPRDAGLKEVGIKALAVLFFMVAWWVSTITNILVTGLLGIGLMLAFGVAPVNVVFSGFSDTTVVFLVFAFALAAAVSKTGLGKRLAFALMSRTRPVYSTILVTYSVVSIILGALIPSGAARTVLLGTIGSMLLPVFGQSEEKQSNVGRGIFTLLGLTGYLGSNAYLTGGASIVLTVGLLAKAGVQLTYLRWLLMAAPVVVLMAVLLALALPRIFPPEVRKVDDEKFQEFREQLSNLGPMSREEKITAVVIGLVILLWVIGDYIGISYLTVGVVGAVVLMLPYLQVTSEKDFNSRIAWDTIYFVGVAMTIGSVLASSGVTPWLAKAANPLLASSSVTVFALKLWLLASVVHLILPSSLPAFTTLMPVIIASAQAQHFSVAVPIMIFAMTYTGVVMVYQQVHSAIAYGFKQFDAADFMKPGLLMVFLWLLLTPAMVWYLSLFRF